MFSEQVREARAKQKLSLRKVAKMTGLSSQFIWDVETGRREASWENMRKIAAALEIAIFFDPKVCK